MFVWGVKYLDIILKPPTKGENSWGRDRKGEKASFFAAGAKGLLCKAGSLCFHSCVVKTTDNVPSNPEVLDGLSKEHSPAHTSSDQARLSAAATDQSGTYSDRP